MLEASQYLTIDSGQKGNRLYTVRVFQCLCFSQGYIQSDVDMALSRLEKLRELIISYTGLTLQDPEMFPQPSGYCHHILA